MVTSRHSANQVDSFVSLTFRLDPILHRLNSEFRRRLTLKSELEMVRCCAHQFIGGCNFPRTPSGHFNQSKCIPEQETKWYQHRPQIFEYGLNKIPIKRERNYYQQHHHYYWKKDFGRFIVIGASLRHTFCIHTIFWKASTIHNVKTRQPYYLKPHWKILVDLRSRMWIAAV